jgi:hypothetical protein
VLDFLVFVFCSSASLAATVTAGRCIRVDKFLVTHEAIVTALLNQISADLGWWRR